jgi:uncharacterized protein YjdB/chitinase
MKNEINELLFTEFGLPQSGGRNIKMKNIQKILAIALSFSMLFTLFIGGTTTASATSVLDFSSIDKIFDWRAPLHPDQQEYGQAYGFPRSATDPQESNGSGGSVIEAGAYVLQDGVLYKQTGNGSFNETSPAGSTPNWYYGWSPKVQFSGNPDYGVLAKGVLIDSYEVVGELDVSPWKQGTAVAEGAYVYFNNKLFRCTLGNSAKTLSHNPITYAGAYTELCDFDSGYANVNVSGLTEPVYVDPAYNSKRVVGYMMINTTGTNLTRMDFSNLDYVNVSFMTFSATGEFAFSGNASDATVKAIIDKAHDAGAKAFISVGGGGGFSQNTLPFYYANSREYLANCILEVVDKFGFDGVDMDAETDDIKFWQGYPEFIKLLRVGIDARNLELSIAVHPWFTDLIDMVDEEGDIYEYYDFFNVMDYDNQFAQDGTKPGIGAVDQAPMWHAYQYMDHYMAKGIPSEKLNIGLPFYYYYEPGNWGARTWAGSAAQINSIVIDAKPGESKADAWWRVNQQKSYLGATEYGGVMIWQLGQDSYNAATRPNMLEMVYKTVKNPLGMSVPTIDEEDKLFVKVAPNPYTDLELTPVDRASTQPTFPSTPSYGSSTSRIAASEYWWLGAKVGEQKTITIPSGINVDWSVRNIANSNPAKSGVISVNNGVITALSEGYAVVDIKVGGVRVASVSVHVLPPLTFADSTAYDIPASRVGVTITSIDVSGGVSGGISPYTFSATGLPAGISIDSMTGVIFGAPTTVRASGTATITVLDSASDEQSITIAYGAISSASTSGPSQTGSQTGPETGSPTLSETPMPFADIAVVKAHIIPLSSFTLPKSVIFSDGTSSDVTWTSSDTSVAGINANGNLIAVREGKFTLTATAPAGKTQSTIITAAKNVTTVRTPLNKIYLMNGKSLTPPVCADSVNPQTKKAETTAILTWKSANPKVASVNASTGKITPKKSGKTVITVTALNGKALKITVHVVKKTVSLKKVTLTKPPKSLKVGKAAILKIKVTPAKATNLKVKFLSSNKKVVSVDKAGKITALGKGKAKITVKIGTKKYVTSITVK